MPDATIVGAIVERLRWLAFPGFFGPRVVDPSGLEQHVGRLLDELAVMLQGQLESAFAYDPIGSHGCQASEASRRASEALAGSSSEFRRFGPCWPRTRRRRLKVIRRCDISMKRFSAARVSLHWSFIVSPTSFNFVGFR